LSAFQKYYTVHTYFYKCTLHLYITTAPYKKRSNWQNNSHNFLTLQTFYLSELFTHSNQALYHIQLSCFTVLMRQWKTTHTVHRQTSCCSQSKMSFVCYYNILC